jgi:hypothetical protein
MDDAVLASKAATIERCCKRAREEYEKDPTTFVGDLTRQDAATLNVIRAWEAAVEMGDYVIGQAKRTGEFCRAEWDYQAAPLPALVTIIKRGLDDFGAYARALLTHAGGT